MASGCGPATAIQSDDKMLQVSTCNTRLDDVLALDRRASLTPGATALLAPCRYPLTYRQLWGHVQTSRNALARLGIGPGEVTALVFPTGPELITAFLAAASNGACAPLDPSLTESEFHFCLSRLRARTLIVPNDTQGPAARAARSLGMRSEERRVGKESIRRG